MKIRRNVLNERYQTLYQQWYEEGKAVVWE
jgi:hypothetical protein